MKTTGGGRKRDEENPRRRQAEIPRRLQQNTGEVGKGFHEKEI